MLISQHRKSFLFIAVSFAMMLLGLPGQSWAQKYDFKPNDRIIFLGDSITQAGEKEDGYLTLMKIALSKNEQFQKVAIVGAGVSGNKVPDIEARLEKDVISVKPTVVVIYIGINDVWHSKSGMGTKKEVFEDGLKRTVKRIQASGARIAFCTPSVIGEKVDGTNPLDEKLEEYCEIVRKIAADSKSQLIDLRKLFIEYLKKKNLQNLEKGILTTDGVHLNASGNRFLAERMLEAFGTTSIATSEKSSGRKLRHFVAFKFKDSVKPEEVEEVVKAFAELPSKIDTIVEFEKGTDVSVEMKSEGYTHAFVVTFADEKGREIYLPHAAHQEFIKLAGPRIEKAFVFDYWNK